MELLFAHETPRSSQAKLIETIKEAVEKKQHCLIHAPTGLGKTAASLAPTLARTLESIELEHNEGNESKDNENNKQKKKTIFFLTSRHTQHQIVIDTVRKIKNKHKKDILTVSIIGKKWMCSQPNADTMNAYDFSEFCKNLRENDQCEFYTRAKTKNGNKTPEAQASMHNLKILSPQPVDQVIQTTRQEKLCPYEISLFMAEKANIIVSDYYYLFNPNIRESFLGKINKKIEDAIIIVDEAHNLPSRARELMTFKLSSIMIKRSLSEAKKYNLETILTFLNELNAALEKLAHPIRFSGEKQLTKQSFVDAINAITDYEQIITDLHSLADDVRKKQKTSALGGLATFLEQWQGSDKGFSRILKVEQGNGPEPIITVSYRCLDPSFITKDVFDNCYMSVIMSGTLTPITMYKDLLGLEDPLMKEFESPFPDEHKLNLIVPKTTTKYAQRSEQQFQTIAQYCAQITNSVPGNVAIFFPSYALRDNIAKYFTDLCTKTQLMESAGLTKDQKKELFEKFKAYQKTGAVLLGAAAGSFGEGVDLPGDLLKGVIVVGVPLEKPDLETQQLINYYDIKFGKGWNYGYLLPAVTKTLQNAGRCIRTEEDKGIIVFLDERYSWPQYFNCFPKSWNLKISLQPQQEVEEFFNEKGNNN